MCKMASIYIVHIYYSHNGRPPPFNPISTKNIKRSYRGIQRGSLKKRLSKQGIKIVSWITGRDRVKFGIPSSAIKAKKTTKLHKCNEFIVINENIFHIIPEKKRNFWKKNERFWKNICLECNLNYK